MVTVQLSELGFIEGWSDTDPTMRVRATFPLHAGRGADSTAVVYFEVEPGRHLGRHTDSAEEVLFVVDGEGEAVVGDERAPVGPGTLALVPALVPHEVYATGDRTLKVLGFFSAAELEHVFDEPIQPMGVSTLGTPRDTGGE